MRREHDSEIKALRHPNVRFSTTWAQNQPLTEIVGHGLQFDLSAVKEEKPWENSSFIAWPVRAYYAFQLNRAGDRVDFITTTSGSTWSTALACIKSIYI